MTDIATVLKSLLDSSSYLDSFSILLEYTTVSQIMLIQFIAFARVTDIATVLKSLLDSSIP